MADPVKLKPIKYSVNGKPYYDLSPDIPSGQQEVTDPNEIQTALADYETRVIGGASGAEQAGLRQRLADYRAGTSTQFAYNEQGVLAEPKQIAAQQAQREAMAADREVAVGGTFDAPLTVPKGTPNPKTATYAQSLAGPAGQIPGIAPVDPNAISKRYEEAFNTQKQQGYQTPTDAVGAKTMFDTFLQDQSASSVANNFVSQDPYLNQTLAAYQQYMSQQNQRTSLVDEYQKLLKTSGIEGIDLQLADMRSILDGVEDDLRMEIQKSGSGIATNSQILALSAARSKVLLKNYNSLLDLRNTKSQYLDTLLNLTKEDRAEADKLFETQMNFGLKLSEISQKMKTNAIESINRAASTIGWDGILQATQNDPYVIRNIEATFGLPAGGLAVAAQRDRDVRALAQDERDLNTRIKEAQLANLQAKEEDKLIEVSPGATLFDPKTGKPIYTSPSKKEGGDGNYATLSPNAKAVVDNPSLLDNYTPTVQQRVIAELYTAGYDTSNLGTKPLSDTAIKNITDSQAALDGLMELRTAVAGNEQYLGPIKGLAALNPWSKAKQIQAQIDKVKQRVGKALEGGVLRKEDEEKYKRILATIYDVPSLAYSKINGLINDVNRDIQNYKDLQQSSGRSLNIKEPLSKKGQSSQGKTSTGNAYTVTKE